MTHQIEDADLDRMWITYRAIAEASFTGEIFAGCPGGWVKYSQVDQTGLKDFSVWTAAVDRLLELNLIRRTGNAKSTWYSPNPKYGFSGRDHFRRFVSSEWTVVGAGPRRHRSIRFPGTD